MWRPHMAPHAPEQLRTRLRNWRRDRLRFCQGTGTAANLRGGTEEVPSRN